LRTVRLLINGRVQGVGYRAWAIATAGSLGLRGWVRNRADGSVEISAKGTEQAVATMIDACRRGPPGARVQAISVVEADDDDGSVGFDARPTA
jgi:acylphosphatase